MTDPAASGGVKGLAFNPADGLLYAACSIENGNLNVLALDASGAVREK